MRLTSLLCIVLLLFTESITAQTSPGGVSSNLSFWLKADAGVTLNGTTVSNWQSQNSGNQVSEGLSTRQPLFNSTGLNFNPALFFDGIDDRLFTNSGYGSHTQIIVFNPAKTVSTSVEVEIVLAHAIGTTGSNAGVGVGSLQILSGGFPSSNFFSSTDIDPSSGGEYIAFLDDTSFSTDDPYLTTLRQSSNGLFEEIILWGHEEASTIQNQNQYGVYNNEGFAIGQRFGDSFRVSFEGDVAEVISFDRRITNNELSRIESYLSIKYGLTLNQVTPQDYVNSLGNTIYDADGVFSGFISNIAGIGRDDASGLNQKQSISTTTNSVQTNNIGLVTIGNGTIAATNLLNTNNFSGNQSFMLWGNNAASTTLDTPITISSQTLNRMSRIWAIQETGTVGTVTLSIPQSTFNNIDPTLIVSNNATIDSSDTAVTLTDDGNGNYTTTINFTNGDFFTFAQSDGATNSTPCDASNPPSNIVASNVTSSSATIDWNSVASASYDLRYRVLGAQNWITTSNLTANTFNISGLAFTTTYEVQVNTRCDTSTSSFSNSIQFTTQDNILSEGFFETGLDGWTDGGNDVARVQSANSSEGLFSIRIRDNSGTASSMTSPIIDATNFDSLEIDFNYFPISMENGEDFWVQFFNGSTYVTVATFRSGTDFSNGSFFNANVVVDASSINFASNSRFRIRCDASNNNDQVFIDEVIITGMTSGPEMVPPVITLNGSSIVDLNVGDTYTELGATATDNIDGDLT
ncbi:fibronectin type III domain-containing protein, partial [Winogradskyella immobilis]